MNLRLALSQTAKVAAVFLCFLVVFAMYLIAENGFSRFADFYLARYIVEGTLTLILVGIVSFIVALIPSK